MLTPQSPCEIHICVVLYHTYRGIYIKKRRTHVKGYNRVSLLVLVDHPTLPSWTQGFFCFLAPLSFHLGWFLWFVHYVQLVYWVSLYRCSLTIKISHTVNLELELLSIAATWVTSKVCMLMYTLYIVLVKTCNLVLHFLQNYADHKWSDLFIWSKQSWPLLNQLPIYNLV